MNLQTYFNQQREQKLSDERKLLLYQRICKERAQSSQTLKRTSLLTKKAVYSFLATLLVFVFFGSFFWDIPEIFEYRAFFVEKEPSGLNTASANHIAEILEFNGDYEIEKEGKTFKNSVLFDGDIITLKDNAKIIFNINEHLKTEIKGPAKFTITQIDEEKYRLYLMEGDFLKVEGQKDTDALQVETKEMTIEIEKDKQVSLELSTNNRKTELKNKGATLLVKSKKSSLSTSPTKLESAKLLTMQDNDITNVSDIKGFANTLMTTSNLTHTTTIGQLHSGDAKTIQKDAAKEIIEIVSGDAEFLATNTATEQIPEDKTQLDSSLAYQKDQKKVPTEKQLSQITAALNPLFLLSDMKEIYEAKRADDQAKIASAYRGLLWRLQSIASSIDVEISVDVPVNQIGKEVEKIQKSFKNYYFPPQKEQQLQIIKNWVTHLSTLNPTQSWEEYSVTLPANLQFK